MKAILIDSVNKEVKYVELDKHSLLKEWYRVIGCNLVCVAQYLDDKHSIIVDDEGAINGISFGFFTLDTRQHLFGNALVVATDEDGNSVDVTMTIEEFDELCPIVWFNTITNN